MLFVVFQIGPTRYALPATSVVEVVPMVELTRVTDAPQGVAGVFSYRGQNVPVVDLPELLLNHPARECLSSRIIVVDSRAHDGSRHRLGLLVERATATLHRPDLAPAANTNGHRPGAVLTDRDGPIHVLSDERLLPEPVRALLAETEVS